MDLLHFMATTSISCFTSRPACFLYLSSNCYSPCSSSPGLPFPSLSSLQTMLSHSNISMATAEPTLPSLPSMIFSGLLPHTTQSQHGESPSFGRLPVPLPLLPKTHTSVVCSKVLHTSFYLWCPTLTLSRQFCPRSNSPNYMHQEVR